MKRLLPLALVALACVFLALFLANRKESEELAQELVGQLVAFDQKEIQKIVLYRKNRNDPVIVFVRKDKEWYISEPEQYPATGYSVDAIAREFSAMKSERKIAPEESGQTLSAFGVTDPRFRITAYTADATSSIALGDKMPIGDKLFIRMGTEPYVHTTNPGIEAYLDKNLTDFRRRDLFWDFPTRVSSVALIYASMVTGFANHTTSADPAWRLTDGTQVQSKKVEDLLRSFKNMTATAFVPESSYFKPERAITIVSERGELTVRFAPKDRSNYLVQIPDRPFLYQVAAPVVKGLFPKSEEYLIPVVPAQPDVAEATSDAESKLDVLESSSTDGAE